ncbi:MAG: hypothetical protein DBX47_02165 [Clostridiales bacterium]|nr:MAG: hypothetical protein DBX47_02165 [Clostridiales bacterium]
MNKLKNALNDIKASDELKQNTAVFLQKEREKKERGQFSNVIRLTIAAVCFLFAVVCISGFVLYYSPYSYISIDVNPSIELSVNRFDRVVSVKAYNNDGNMLIKNISLFNKRYTDAIETLFSENKFTSYLGDNSLLTFTVVSQKESEIINNIQACNGYAQYKANCFGAKNEDISKAHETGLSFGKYKKYMELLQYDPEITPEECINMSMRELQDLINKYTSSSDDKKDGDGENKPQNGNGMQNGKGNQNGNGYGKNS